MMQKQLENSFTGRGQRIMSVLEAQGFVRGMDIDYQHCDEVNQLELGEFEKQAQAITSSCEKIAALMSQKTKKLH